jgi:hypothetical protein
MFIIQAIGVLVTMKKSFFLNNFATRPAFILTHPEKTGMNSRNSKVFIWKEKILEWRKLFWMER